MRLVQIDDCMDCPYYREYSLYTVECELQEDEFGCMRQVNYSLGEYEQAIYDLESRCPLLTVDDVLTTPNNIIYETYHNISLKR